MRTKMSMLAALGLALATVSCGDDGTSTTSGPATSGPATTATATTTPVAELEANLLTVGDLPAGWELGEPMNEMDFADSTQLPCEDSALNPTIAARLTPVAGVQFSPTDGSAKHLMEMVVAGEPTQLEQDFAIFLDAYGACQASLTTAPAPAPLTITELALPELGDQQAAFLMKGYEDPGSPETSVVWYVRDADVRVGGVLVEVALTEILDSMDATPTITDAEFAEIVATAVAQFSE